MTEMITLQTSMTQDGRQTSFPACLAAPSGGTPKGGLIVIHEVWGLTEHTKDVARRLSAEGYLVLAPDLLSGEGVDLAQAGELQRELFDPEHRSQAQPKLRQLMAPLRAPGFAETATAKLRACMDYLAGQGGIDGRLAVTGFCFGGSYSFALAVADDRLRAAAPFYGHADYSIEQLSAIHCPVLAFYGEQDRDLVAGLPALQDKMRQAGVDFTVQVYPGCGHAFFNDTNQFTYNRAAADDAWRRLLAFLDWSLAT